MSKIEKLYQTADWKNEKHVPVIEWDGRFTREDEMSVTVTIGKEIAHPNTTAHHIEWVEAYFHPEGEKFPYLVGRFQFASHGASTEGPDTSTVFTAPFCVFKLKTGKTGTLIANSYCNIHGLWTNSQEIA